MEHDSSHFRRDTLSLVGQALSDLRSTEDLVLQYAMEDAWDIQPHTHYDAGLGTFIPKQALAICMAPLKAFDGCSNIAVNTGVGADIEDVARVYHRV